MIFEYVVITRLSKKKKEDDGLEEIKFGPGCVAARDDETAMLKAAKDCEGFDPDTMEVLVRPFDG